MRKFEVYQEWYKPEGSQGEAEQLTGWMYSHNDTPIEDDQLVDITQHDKDGNPIRGFVFVSNEVIIERASVKYGEFLQELGFNYKSDPHMENTPLRVAKAWVNDLSSSLFNEPPKVTSFGNDGEYPGMVVQRDIPISSMCAHHNLPFTGFVHIAYIPDKKVIGLSKLNRIADFFARKPTVQETLTKEISDFVNSVCEGNKGVAVIVNAGHSCVSCRGIRHDSNMVTSVLTGEFYDDSKTREEFFMLLGLKGSR